MADKIINNNLSDKEINNIILQINERLNSLYDLSEDEIEILKQ